MPRFFKRICWVCSLISGTALAVNTAVMAAGAEMPEWWAQAFPYLVGIPAGMAFMAKFTVNGGYDDHTPDPPKGRESVMGKDK